MVKGVKKSTKKMTKGVKKSIKKEESERAKRKQEYQKMMKRIKRKKEIKKKKLEKTPGIKTALLEYKVSEGKLHVGREAPSIDKKKLEEIANAVGENYPFEMLYQVCKGFKSDQLTEIQMFFDRKEGKKGLTPAEIRFREACAQARTTVNPMYIAALTESIQEGKKNIILAHVSHDDDDDNRFGTTKEEFDQKLAAYAKQYGYRIYNRYGDMYFVYKAGHFPEVAVMDGLFTRWVEQNYMEDEVTEEILSNLPYFVKPNGDNEPVIDYTTLRSILFIQGLTIAITAQNFYNNPELTRANAEQLRDSYKLTSKKLGFQQHVELMLLIVRECIKVARKHFCPTAPRAKTGAEDTCDA
jgi:hypothetical protein